MSRSILGVVMAKLLQCPLRFRVSTLLKQQLAMPPLQIEIVGILRKAFLNRDLCLC